MEGIFLPLQIKVSRSESYLYACFFTICRKHFNSLIWKRHKKSIRKEEKGWNTNEAVLTDLNWVGVMKLIGMTLSGCLKSKLLVYICVTLLLLLSLFLYPILSKNWKYLRRHAKQSLQVWSFSYFVERR